MNYYSLNHRSPIVSFRDATIFGQAPDKGLYFPGTIPEVSKNLISGIDKIPDEEIAFEVIRPYVGDTIPADRLLEIVQQTISFLIPLVQITDKIFSLELFHGPTLAFKDVGARFMSRCLGYFVEQGIEGINQSKKITVLVATSGDTGGAVASGFYDVEGIDVVILYPSGKVSPVQEKQLTTPGKNIHALEVEGSFDDCQSMVKQAFVDEELKKKLFLTSANSINVARWLPQQFYYFLAYKQWNDKSNPPVVSVPSGNFGNICAGILAKQSGLPIAHFIAACNENDVVTRYLQNEEYNVKPAVPTLSNAMDVGDPSNFIRVLEIFQKNYPALKTALSSVSVSDKETIETIKKVFTDYQYLLDPHGAVGYMALKNYLDSKNQKGIFLETAHPVKFPQAVEEATGKPVQLPKELHDLLSKPQKSTYLKTGYENLKEYLFNK